MDIEAPPHTMAPLNYGTLDSQSNMLLPPKPRAPRLQQEEDKNEDAKPLVLFETITTLSILVINVMHYLIKGLGRDHSYNDQAPRFTSNMQELQRCSNFALVS